MGTDRGLARRYFLAPCSIALLVKAPRAAAERLWRRTPIDFAGPFGYFIDEARLPVGALPEDRQLAEWALQAWDHATRGLLCFYPAPATNALVRIYWGQAPQGLGFMQAIQVGDLRGAEVYVEPRPGRFDAALGERCRADPLFRDAVIYRTLLHEIGHALGLVHTVRLDDAMYFGGDVSGFYARYRKLLTSRQDIRRNPGLSLADRNQIRRLYPEAALRRREAPKQSERPAS